MPLYAFRCTRCGAEFEVSRRLSARNDPANCPADGGAGERMLTAPSLIGSAKREAAAEPGEANAKAKQAASKWSHFGHSHGAGIGGHSHGAPKPPPTLPAT